MSSVGGFMVQHNVAALTTRTESTMASSVRLVQYPNGTQALQGGYLWNEGFKGGVVWRDLPVIMVGVSGQELQDDPC